MNCFERAMAIKDEITTHRRHIHQNPEVGVQNPNTRSYVMERLKEMGIEAQECGEGATAILGQGDKLILLRADMDALPLAEESGLEFASKTGQAHACGHDLHTAMLLGAARLLKEKEGELKGRVKLMFQSGEEVMQGAMNMIQHGVLDPLPDAALAYHVGAGRFEAGVAANVIPDTAHLEGSMRTDSTELRDKLVHRLKELSEGIAKAYGGSAQVKMNGGAPPLICNGDFTREICGYMQELPIPNLTPQNGIRSSASEDFSYILEKVPGTFIYLSAGFDDERGDAPAHSPKVQFNEEVLPIGAACLAHCATRWLEQHSAK